MPKISGTDAALTPVRNIDEMAFSEAKQDGLFNATQEELEFAFVKKLQRYGLEEIRVQVVFLRVVCGWTFQQVANELAIPNRQTANYLYRSSLRLLRERGYDI